MDLTKLSDAELQALYEKGKTAPPDASPAVEPPKLPSVVRVQAPAADAPAAPVDLSKMPLKDLQALREAQTIKPDQYGVTDPAAASVLGRDYKATQFADDVIRNVANGATFGTADKAAAFLDRNVGQPLASGVRSLGASGLADYLDVQFGKGSYDELLAKARKETAEAGGRLGPYGEFLAQAGGGMLTGGNLAKAGITLLGRVPKTAGLLMKMGAGGVEGAAYGALSGAGHTDTGKLDDYVDNAIKGGLLGGVTGAAFPLATAVGSKIITPLPTSDPVRAKAMQTLEDAGVDVSAGTKTGSPKLRRAEEVISHNPLGGPNPTEEQMAQVTQSVMEKAGITGPRRAATPDAVKEGYEKVGGRIGDIQGRYAVPVDDTLLNAAAKVESEIKPLVAEGLQKPLQHFIDKITSGAELKPDAAQSIRTQLLEEIKGATGAHQKGLLELKNALDDALARTMQKAGDHAGLADLQLARNQYAHLHILSDALNASGGAGMRGELTPTALARALQKSVGRVGFTKGEGDLNDLARASAGYLQPPRSSGTSENESMWNPARWAMGAAGRVAVNNPIMQGYWGNQAAGPASGAAMQPPVTGLISGTAGSPDAQSGIKSGLLGPADRLMQQLQGR